MFELVCSELIVQQTLLFQLDILKDQTAQDMYCFIMKTLFFIPLVFLWQAEMLCVCVCLMLL